jgi:glycosyltransferase involved in cell wall biosynthesis
MSIRKILYIYPWATLGGVERVLLNRAIAFKNHRLEVRQDVHFLHRTDACRIFEQSIEKLGISGFLGIVDKSDFSDYDCISVIDAPEVFGSIDDHHVVFVECHTPYPENRTYLKKLPSSIKGVIVPSDYFGDQIRAEVPDAFRNRIFRLRNCVPDAESEFDGESPRAYFNKIPIAYVGRADYNKNTAEIVQVFAELRKRVGDNFMLLIAGPVVPGIDLVAIAKKHRVLDRFVLLPPMPFQNVSGLLNLIRVNKGIFFSASKGESFGLSVVEAMTHHLPMVLSDRHAHLVGDASNFLYKLGSVDSAILCIENILNDYESAVNGVIELGSRYSEHSFIEDWQRIF